MEITQTPHGRLSARDAIVEEQDNFLLAGVKPEVKDSTESYPVLVGKMQRQQPLSPGRVLVRRGTPTRFIAIIYDFGQKPPCRDEWLITALRNIIAECNSLQVQTLFMPVLGECHGDITAEYFRQLLEEVIAKTEPAYPERICLANRDRLDAS